ncbi:hypothetical protein [Comamonas sp. JUb58]|uniref:hypothetical protein n=1 Tax=Comamonas sp. JUb58 TaxID=2485114 RepID=UPI00105C24EE|nr:hypothetical protein [Comamonas sp. JUb58]TDS73390.1 hypothetical protein EDF71_12164 [Comamonas sp. JUb58]
MLFSEIFNSGGGSGANLWISGVPVPQWGLVISPLDGEVYRRTTATGAGTVDPANDITNYMAASYRRVTALTTYIDINNLSSTADRFANGATKLNMNITVNTRTNLLNVTGRGLVQYLGVIKAAASGGRLEVLIDGRSIFDKTVGTVNANYAAIVVGSAINWTTDNGASNIAAYTALPEEGVEFKRSLQVFYTPLTVATTVGTFAYMLRETK